MNQMRELVRKYLIKKAEGEEFNPQAPADLEEQMAHRELMAAQQAQDQQMPEEQPMPEEGMDLTQEQTMSVTEKFMTALQLMLEIAEELGQEEQAQQMYAQQFDGQEDPANEEQMLAGSKQAYEEAQEPEEEEEEEEEEEYEEE